MVLRRLDMPACANASIGVTGCYSGGAGGGPGPLGAGGGGGSFDAGTDQILVADARTDNGEVIIAELAAAVPEPASISLLGGGLARISRTRLVLQELAASRQFAEFSAAAEFH
jgi:hypothetical protein